MLGVCYYPDQWPERLWADDAARMAALGLSVVRIGEFAWSRFEPAPGAYDWAWFDRAVDTLARAGLKLVLGTPTATPPKWLVDEAPEILPVDDHGRPRRFGSRRHYCFSSPRYREEAARIVAAMADRYGRHDAVIGWQTDNEFGCHATVRSYSPAAAAGFRRWALQRYGTIGALNEAWGNHFWSMDYRDFAALDPPWRGVTELNPAHRLAFARFASDEVAAFNRMQVDVLRARSPGRFVTHNFMGAFLDFDHWKLGRDLDLASWDSYPLGFTDSIPWLGLDAAERTTYARTGHPDIAGFHHDLYRGVGRGRFWVMEQQPGPVNWALWNPAPLPGMVRLWSWEALAHGAEAVVYFRWRQTPTGQEQMHAGLNRPDNVLDIGGHEAGAVARELSASWWREAASGPAVPGQAAIVFDYEAAWMSEIQPQGMDWSWFALVYGWYGALRRLGLQVDLVPPGADLTPYRLVIAPALAHVSEQAVAAFAAAPGLVLYGPRTGAKTVDFAIPADLPPGPLQALTGVRVTRVESLRPGLTGTLALGNRLFPITRWREHVEPVAPDVTVRAVAEDGQGVLFGRGRHLYLAAWPDRSLQAALVEALATEAGLTATPLPEGVRQRSRGGVTFAFNWGPAAVTTPAPAGARYLLGGPELPVAGVAAWA